MKYKFMTTEEKAKAYDEALETAKNVLETDLHESGVWAIKKIFPELKESEDEKIREGLLRHLEELRDWKADTMSPIKVSSHYDAWIAYLEKQKINTEGDFGRGYDCGYKACLNSHGAEFFEKQKEQKEPLDKGEISDGYHTFNELYYYRLLYNAAFFNLLPKEWVHKSKRHDDGKECFGGGWFIVMANLPTGQISNHYEIKDWDLFHIPEKETADKWDGHTPQEAAERLHKFLLEMLVPMPIEYLPKKKIYDIIDKLTDLSYSKLIPFKSRESQKIDEISTDILGLLDYPIEKKQEQKPTEFDEYKIIKKHITEDVLSSEVNKRLTECGWYVTDKKPEWSEEDLQHKSWILECLADGERKMPEYAEDFRAAYKWLKSLHQQPKNEWNEEDEWKREGIIQWFRKHQKTYNPKYDSLSIESIDSLINWFKSLRSKPHWKPTKEQIEYLSKAILTLGEEGDAKTAAVLNELRKDLKKMMEE